PPRSGGYSMNLSDFLIMWDELPTIMNAFLNTIMIIGISGVFTLIVGIAFTPLLMSKNLYVSKTATFYCECMRCVPFLLFVYIIYFGFPSFGIQLSNWTTGIIALIIYHSAYLSIVFKGAWQDIPKETIDAGKAFG